MNKIKTLLAAVLSGFVLLSCSKEIMIPVSQCEEGAIEFNEGHPYAEEIESIMEKYVSLGYPGLTVLVSTPQDGKWMGSKGVSRIENQQPMNNCNIYHSASVAKSYHAVAAMSLVEEGKLSLDVTIDQYLPQWLCQDLPNRSSATVRQLMNHTSGIPDFISELNHLTDYFQNIMREFTIPEYMDYICGDDADFEAGTRTYYSNTNTVLLALIMDEVAGNHADVITEKIIKKLNLKRTFYKNEAGYPAPEGAVNTYLDVRGNGKMINSTEYERNFANMNIGHDAIMASPNDYFLFIEGLFTGKLLSQESLDEMIEYASYPSAVKRGEGLGLEVTEAPLGVLTRIGHNGGSLGAANNVFYYPEKDTYIVTCSNYGDFVDGPLTQYNWSGLIGNQETLLGELELLLFEE